MQRILGSTFLALALVGCGASVEEETEYETSSYAEGSEESYVQSEPRVTDGETDVTVTGEDGREIASAPAPAQPTAAPTTNAAAPATTPAPAAELTGESCPTAIEGVRVQVSNAARGVRITFMGPREQLDEVRMRVRRLADETRASFAASQNAVATTTTQAATTSGTTAAPNAGGNAGAMGPAGAPTSAGTSATGTQTGPDSAPAPATGATASAEVAVVPTLEVEDHPRGARMSIAIESRPHLAELRRIARDWAEQIRGGTCSRIQLQLQPAGAQPARAEPARPAQPSGGAPIAARQ